MQKILINQDLFIPNRFCIIEEYNTNILYNNDFIEITLENKGLFRCFQTIISIILTLHYGICVIFNIKKE